MSNVSNRSNKSSRYGALVENEMRESYGLDVPEDGRTAWKDAVDGSGTPWDIKAAMRNRKSGSPGRFRIFQEPHQQLAERDGWYAFAVYVPRGNGVQVVDSNAVRARALRLDWVESGHGSPNRGKQEKQLPIERVMAL